MRKNSFRYFGSGLLIAVGYMDPGNWATDIAAGSRFGYSLLFIIFLAGIMGMFLQHLSIKLSIATGKDLAQMCAQEYNKPVRIILWFFAEIAIIACDLAEVIGSALALNLLFDLPILLGAVITILDTFLVLYLMNKSLRYLEAVIAVLMLTITLCFIYNFIVWPPAIQEILVGLTPPIHLIHNKEAILISVGILGATVMPHNLYLHGHIVGKKLSGNASLQEKKTALKFFTLDSNLSLVFACLINAFILILAASHFYTVQPVDSIEDAYRLLSPIGLTLASTLFAIALLASGQNATFTGTLAGQAVMEGFLNLNFSPLTIRLVTRLIALVPVIIFLGIFGNSFIDQLLILSQVVLSLQLPFAVIPMLLFTRKKRIMGEFVNTKKLSTICWLITCIILLLNFFLIWSAIEF